MGPSLLLLLLLPPSLLFTLFPSLSQAYVIPLHPHWSFSADLSLTSPLPLNAYTSPSPTLFTPILSSLGFSSGKGFSLGFYSLFKSSSSIPTSIYLTVCLGTNKTDVEGRAFAVPVWHFDRSRPLKQVGKEGLVSMGVNSTSKELVLRDGDGRVVFKMGNVEAMEMQANGNWALYDADNKVIWQSFDHPSDTLLQGQYLDLGAKLMSNNSLYIAEMMPGGLLFYANVRAPSYLAYWASPLNISVVEYATQHPFELSRHPQVNLTSALESYIACSSSSSPPSPHPTPFAVLDGQNITVHGDCSSMPWPIFGNIYQNATVVSDFVVLANDGYPKGYTYFHLLGQNLLFSDQANSSYCLAPYSCGAYGICAEYLVGLQHTCQCPSSANDPEFIDAFAPIDASDPVQGCHRTVPLQCSDNNTEVQSLVEIKGSTFISIHPIFETNYMHNTFALPECIARCERNCSCSGFFYHRDTSFCLPFSDDGEGGFPSVTIISMDGPEFSTYVKVQKPMAANRDSSKAGHSSSHLSKAVVFAICTAVLVCVLLSGAVLILRYNFMKKMKEMEDDEDPEEAGDEELRVVLPLLPLRFSYKELYKITGGFSTKNLIGFGGFGCVYLGIFPNGRKVAVKKIDQGSLRVKQFLAEVATIRDVSHFNIAPLCGFCSQKSQRLLVYEYMENGSLDQWLFSDSKDRLLDWTTRYQIALGTARGLVYLHEECPRPIIHFDVKPQNILLDREFVAKISDFGMCKLVGRAESSCVMTGVRGTPGYLAPEWLSQSVVGKKCDVYSYGMVLLELVGGRKNAVQALVGTEQWYFPAWAAILCKQGRVVEIVDKRLEGVFDEGQVRRMIHVAFLCIQKDPTMRPSMGCACKMIEGSMPLGDEDPPFDLALALEPPLSPECPASASLTYSYSCTSALIVGR